jgi:TetR/AcrR family transcriptional regulator, transcriptional repressor for nem operon
MAHTLSKSYEDLVKDAQHIFWTKGFKSISAQELADHLGVSPSIIYNKYTKDMLFLDALEMYITYCSDPVLTMIKEEDQGIESFRSFFYKLIDALLTRSFPKSCLIVNTVVEMRNEHERVSNFYDKYFVNMVDAYLVVLNRAYELGEIKRKDKIGDYADFLVGVIFSMSIFYKIKSKEELQQYIDDQLSLIK